MPHGATARVKSRAAQVLRMIEERGCVSTALLASALGVNMNEAYYAARLLERGGSVARVVLGQHSLWCSGREAAEAVTQELKKELAGVLCRSGARYATPVRAYRLVAADKQARATFLRYAPYLALLKYSYAEFTASSKPPRLYAFMRMSVSSLTYGSSSGLSAAFSICVAAIVLSLFLTPLRRSSTTAGLSPKCLYTAFIITVPNLSISSSDIFSLFARSSTSFIF